MRREIVNLKSQISNPKSNMCGIAGIIDPTLTKENVGSLLNKMLESIAHRGPDNRGVWIDMPVALGHNRLSIIDLSDAGNQPMEFFDAVITFNGEIYNYIEVGEVLKKKGYRFTTHSDTEVILAAWREYGKDCVKHFVGMWAFAIWDKKNKQLFCSRDRFGIKPFYYIHEGQRLYFGSEYKPLKLSPLFSNDLNLEQVSRGLQLGWLVYHDETYYKKLKALPEATNLIFADGNVTIEKYWDIETGNRFNGTFDEKKNKFYELFKESVDIHLRSEH